MKAICILVLSFAFVLLLGASTSAISVEDSTETTQKKLIKIAHKEEGEYISHITTNGKDIVMISAISDGYMLVYNDLGEFQYTLQYPGGGSIQYISFIDDNTVKMIYGKGNTPYIFNLDDLVLHLVNSGKSEDVPFALDKVQVANGNIFKLGSVFPLQTEVKMYYDQGKSIVIYRQNLKNTIIVISLIAIMLAVKWLKMRQERKKQEEGT